MTVYINRVLNMKKIKAIGFDMDHTIVRYKTRKFESLTYKTLVEKLVKQKDYPASIRKLRYNFKRVIQGLMIDMRYGNLIKISRFGKVKRSYHGTKPIDFKKQNEIYSSVAIDPRDDHIVPLDTSFSLAHGILFAQLVDLKDDGARLPSYQQITDDLQQMLDEAHTSGELKEKVSLNLEKYIIQDPEIVRTLEKLKSHKRKLILITNSDYSYTKLLLDYAIGPFLENHESWKDLFHIIITLARKPNFFIENQSFLKVDHLTGLMSNMTGPIGNGIYQGGGASKLQEYLGMKGEEILYIGDHIYGDVVKIKKQSNWRTALVVEPLFDEINSLFQVKTVQKKIDCFMNDKRELEVELNKLYSRKNRDEYKVKKMFVKIEKIDSEVARLIKSYQKAFNSYWGELMRAGQEESFFADQVERYACIYMPRITDLLDYSPRTYFRPSRRLLAHEMI
ncbi:MAG: HAD-IG family 5'-nucleotidase [Bacteriovoracaceae bacterium]|nr:HAD-IG family 5'-nucleotidase [Bacteriovoracaceae bacterium]